MQAPVLQERRRLDGRRTNWVYPVITKQLKVPPECAAPRWRSRPSPHPAPLLTAEPPLRSRTGPARAAAAEPLPAGSCPAAATAPQRNTLGLAQLGHRPGVSRPAGAGQGGQGSGTSVGFTADSQPARATQPLSLARRAKGPAAPTAAGGDGEAVPAATGAAALPAPQQCPPSHPDPKGQELLQGKRAEGGTPAPRPLPAPGGTRRFGLGPSRCGALRGGRLQPLLPRQQRAEEAPTREKRDGSAPQLHCTFRRQRANAPSCARPLNYLEP